MVAIFAVLGILTSVAVARAAIRARLLLKQVPPEFFVVQGSSHAAGEKLYYPGGFERTMTDDEARRLLAVPHGCKKSIIAAQHKKLLSYNHPDKGGSTLLASKINEAKNKLTRDL